MKLRNLVKLNEMVATNEEDAVPLLREAIKQPMVEHYGGWQSYIRAVQRRKVPLRGMLADYTAMKKSVRSERMPRDTSEMVHEFLDEYFQVRYGHRYRSNAMFASTSSDVGEFYGGDPSNEYVVIPEGNYKVCWSPVVGDLLDVEDKIIAVGAAATGGEYVNDAERYEIVSTHKNDDDVVDAIFKLFDTFRYKQSNNITDAIANAGQHELMIACKSYYAFRTEELPNILGVMKQ